MSSMNLLHLTLFDYHPSSQIAVSAKSILILHLRNSLTWTDMLSLQVVHFGLVWVEPLHFGVL